MPIGVLAVYAALAIWIGLAVKGARGGGWRWFLLFGIGLMLFLNVRYVIEGPAAGIAFFIGIYDVLINLGVTASSDLAAMGTCPDNACTVWGDTFAQHPGWAVAFYDRFANGPELRSTLLLGHIVCNSIAFVLLHVQMFRPGGRYTNHRFIGQMSFGFLTVSLICAVWLASQHGPVAEYGGGWAQYGFYSMAAFVYGTAIMGVAAIKGGDAAKHRIWMWRYAGAMWGSFWLFRVVLFVIDPIFRDVEALAINVCIWGSAPAGILMAELIRRRLDAPVTRTAAVPAE
ncbi:MAG: hypothetical protein AAF401_03590 [Pseudomonadota bacterium]